MATVHDVAAYILEKRGPMTTMKLQKLVYYSQAWSGTRVISHASMAEYYVNPY